MRFRTHCSELEGARRIAPDDSSMAMGGDCLELEHRAAPDFSCKHKTRYNFVDRVKLRPED
jgi:hypothetical protein